MLKFKLWLLQNFKIILLIIIIRINQIINLSIFQAKWNTTWYSHNFDILLIKKIIIKKLKLGLDLIGLYPKRKWMEIIRCRTHAPKNKRGQQGIVLELAGEGVGRKST